MKKQGLSKSERIKRRSDFEKVYKFGHSVVSSDKKFKATYLYERIFERGLIKAAFAVHRKAGKAVWRNRMKRLMREAYRRNKLILYDSVDLSEGSLLIVFSPNVLNEKQNKKVKYEEVVDPILELMSIINDELTSDA